MLIWCACCQSLLRESPPFWQFSLSHGICESCRDRFGDQAERPDEQAKRDYFDRMLRAGLRADAGDCARIRDEGVRLGLAHADIAWAGVCGVLDNVGRRWEAGTLSVADEHRATRWCEEFLSGMPPLPASDGALDLFGTVAPDNQHILGARLAEYVLRARGLAADIVVPGLPDDEFVDLVMSRPPRAVAISCGLPAHYRSAQAMFERLRSAGYMGLRFLVGAAVRRSPPKLDDSTIMVAQTLWQLIERFRACR